MSRALSGQGTGEDRERGRERKREIQRARERKREREGGAAGDWEIELGDEGLAGEGVVLSLPNLASGKGSGAL